MRTRKLSTILTDDAAVQFDMLCTILGLSGKFRKQSDVDAALIKNLMKTYNALVQTLLETTGKSWCDPADVELLVMQLLSRAKQASSADAATTTAEPLQA